MAYSAHAESPDSTIATKSAAPKATEVSVVVLPPIEERLTILAVGLVILVGFGLLLNGKRRQADAEKKSYGS